MEDVANRLTRARRASSLVVIPANEAAQNRVRDPKTALAALGATHTLQVKFHKAGETAGRPGVPLRKVLSRKVSATAGRVVV